MDDKGKGFSLRQKKSKRVPNISGPKISAPIKNYAEQPSQPAPRPKPRAGQDTTGDLVKRRYSTRFNQLPDFSNANAPLLPGVPTLPDAYAKKANRAPGPQTSGQKIPVDVHTFKDQHFDVEKYSSTFLADGSDRELQDLQASLQKLKNRASTDLQQNVYQNRTQFIKVSKEAEKLRGEMRSLRGLMSELTATVSQAAVNAGAPEPKATLDDGPRSRARKQANRSSVANLEALWSTQLHALWKNVEGSQKFLPAIPGRHIVTEQSFWTELDPATWKAKRNSHIFLLNDHLMIATKRKSKQGGGQRTIADKCFPLQEVDMVDLASVGAGLGDRGGMSNAISIRCGHDSFTYRADRPTNAEKTKLLQDFRRTADELRKTLRANMKEHSANSKENMELLATRDPSLSQNEDLLRKLGDDKDRPEIMIEVDGKHQNLRWVEGQIDELESEIALQRFEEAVRRIEKLRKLARGLKGNVIAQDLITTKVDERARQLADKLTHSLSFTHAHLNPTQLTISQLSRLQYDALARTTYLTARSHLITLRARSIIFEGDLRHHIYQLSFVYFTLMRNTVKTFSVCFPPPMMSACVSWCHARLGEFNDLLGRQLSSVQRGSPTWNDCVERAREHAALMGGVGMDFRTLVRAGSGHDGDGDGEGERERVLLLARA